MDADQYQSDTERTQLYSDAAMRFVTIPVSDQIRWLELAYCTGKLNGEAGEVAEIIFKAFRGSEGELSGEDKYNLQKELGDVLWYVARISALIGVPLSEIMRQNIEKLLDRKERGVVHGYGDER